MTTIKAMITALIIFFMLAVLYILTLMGRTGHKGLASLRGHRYAHRGLHGNGIPENSMAAFQAALDRGYGIELDIHLMKDGKLAVIHDSSLKRTAGADVKIEELTANELCNYRLEGTDEKIPLFSQVLELYAGKAPLIVELKTEGKNHDALVLAVKAMMADYPGAFCVESFDPFCVHALKKLWPQVIRGQLSENFLKANPKYLNRPLQFVMTFLLSSFLTRPDFIAYRYADRKNLSVWLSRRLWHLQGVTWTIKSPEDLDTAVAEGYLPIFEGFTP